MNREDKIIMLRNMKNFLLNELPKIIKQNIERERQEKSNIKVLVLNRKTYSFRN